MTYNANRISNNQMMIARNLALPTITVSETIEASDYSSKESVITISNLSGKMNNYYSDIVSFLRCDYAAGEVEAQQTVYLPLENYYIVGTITDQSTGVLERKHTLNNYVRLIELDSEITKFNVENPEKKYLEVEVYSYLKVGYLDLLEQPQEIYYEITPNMVRIIEPPVGRDQIEKYQKILEDGYGVNFNRNEKITVDFLIEQITEVLSVDGLYDIENIENVLGERKMDYSLWISLIGALGGSAIGGFCTLYAVKCTQKGMREQADEHAASMLYYDLKSIEKYLSTERSSVNLRYSENWQSMVSDCGFLKDNQIEIIYEVYDLAYNYNYFYNLKEREGAVIKESIPQYESLKAVMFDISKGYTDYDIYSEKYENLLKILQSHTNK